MTKAEYMMWFTDRLKKIPDDRRQEIIEDIMAHFTDGASEGIPEETLSEGLGPPETLAKEYRAIYATEQASAKPSIANVMRVVWAGIGMGMLNLIFVLPFAAAIFAVWLTLIMSGVAMAIVGAIAMLISLINLIIPLSFAYIPYPVGTIFVCLMTASLGALLFIGSLYMGRALAKYVTRYVEANIEIISGRRKKNA